MNRFARTLAAAAIAAVALTGTPQMAGLGMPAVSRPEDVGLSTERLPRIHETVQRFLDAKQLSGAVTLVARRGRIAHFEAHGVMDLEAGTPMRKDAIFRIASMSKPVTGVAIMMLLTFGLLFYMEKLWRTRIILVVVGVSLITGALISGFSEKMPLAIQRTLSFLPLELDPMVKISADDSSEWRLELWQEAWKQVPTYLFKGKGYTFNVDDMYMANYSFLVGNARNWEWALISGDYHNGPLSLLIPFGIYGLLAFLWLILAGCRYLYQVYRDGPPELRRINALLFAYFMGRAVFFFTIYGAVAHDLYVFTGILGLSVALNVPDQPKTEPLPNAELEPSPQI